LIRIYLYEDTQPVFSYKSFWQNFLLDVVTSINNSRGTINEIRDILHEEYNAEMNHDEMHVDFLEFKNTDDATSFILKWS